MKTLELGKYHLEYKEENGMFHFNNGNHNQNTNGWRTVCENISDEQCSEFYQWIADKYPNREEYLSFDTVKNEFEKFLLT